MRDDLSPDTRKDQTRFCYFTRSGRLQRVLDDCGISKVDFDEFEKGLFKL